MNAKEAAEVLCPDAPDDSPFWWRVEWVKHSKHLLVFCRANEVRRTQQRVYLEGAERITLPLPLGAVFPSDLSDEALRIWLEENRLGQKSYGQILLEEMPPRGLFAPQGEVSYIQYPVGARSRFKRFPDAMHSLIVRTQKAARIAESTSLARKARLEALGMELPPRPSRLWRFDY